jgi:spore coat protein SA
MFTLRHTRIPTLYDVANEWIVDGIRNDPWLRWWCRPSGPFASNLARTLFEMIGARGRMDATTPTRLAKGYERVPEVFGDREKVEPNSISAFRFDRVFFCSHFLKQKTETAGFRVSHGEIIYPGIATERFCSEVKPASAPFKKLLVVTRLTAQSGVMTVLKALQHAREQGVKCSLSIFGSGESDYVAGLRSFVVTNQLPVEFLTVSNQVKDLAAIYRAHDAFIHCSETEEPFPTLPLEAMATGLLLIGTRSGGIGEVLRTGENAFTFTPGDFMELSSRIQEAQLQPALRCQFAERGQSDVLSQFSDTSTMDQIESFLTTTLEVWRQT